MTCARSPAASLLSSESARMIFTRVASRSVARRGDAQRENGACVERIDHPVVPEARGRVIGRALRLVLLADARLELLALGVAAERADHREDHGRLLPAHDADARVRPHPQLPRLVRAASHAVVPRAKAAPDDHCELRDDAAGDGGDHLRAVLGDAARLVLLADHESADVLEEDERHAALIAELDEMRRPERRLAEQNAVVRDDAASEALDAAG